MKKRIDLRTRYCIVTTGAVVAILANTLSTWAQGSAEGKIGRKPTAPTLVADDAQFGAIQARANAAATKLKAKDAKSVSRANAELAKVHADLVAYTQKNGLKITTETVRQHGVAMVQACSGTQTIAGMKCTLRGSKILDGSLICDYDCVPQPKTIKQ